MAIDEHYLYIVFFVSFVLAYMGCAEIGPNAVALATALYTVVFLGLLGLGMYIATML